MWQIFSPGCQQIATVPLSKNRTRILWLNVLHGFEFEQPLLGLYHSESKLKK
jgi:hypothetical protein